MSYFDDETAAPPIGVGGDTDSDGYIAPRLYWKGTFFLNLEIIIYKTYKFFSIYFYGLVIFYYLTIFLGTRSTIFFVASVNEPDTESGFEDNAGSSVTAKPVARFAYFFSF